MTPALVCIGSLHPAARSQADALAELGWDVVMTIDEPGRIVGGDRVVLITPPLDDHAGGDELAAHRLGGLAREYLGHREWGSLVLVGGDTAAAVLGEVTVTVGGLLAPGVPWGMISDTGPLVIAKPGGFGGLRALAELFEGGGP